MPRPAQRSTSWAKKKLTTPGGKKVTHYDKKKNSAAKCSECGATLNGTPKKTTAELRKLPKTKKRPERAYGGAICPACLKKKIISEKVLKASK